MYCAIICITVYNITIEYCDIEPWGRSFDEYVRMFSLNPADFERKIMGCGDGSASFNAELTERGGNITSVDPVYYFNADHIR
jgi:hypothetical protein